MKGREYSRCKGEPSRNKSTACTNSPLIQPFQNNILSHHERNRLIRRTLAFWFHQFLSAFSYIRKNEKKDKKSTPLCIRPADDFDFPIRRFKPFLFYNFKGSCAKIKVRKAKSPRFFLAGQFLGLVVVSLVPLAPLICSHLTLCLSPTLASPIICLLDSFSGFGCVTPSTARQHSEYERKKALPLPFANVGCITI